MNSKGYGRERSWPNLRYDLSICLEGLKKTTKHLSQNSRSPGKAVQCTVLWRWQPSGILCCDYDDDGVSTHFWNVGVLQRDCTALCRRRVPSSYSPPWEPEISLLTVLGLLRSRLFLPFALPLPCPVPDVLFFKGRVWLVGLWEGILWVKNNTQGL
jgi:hypothetical protein